MEDGIENIMSTYLHTNINNEININNQSNFIYMYIHDNSDSTREYNKIITNKEIAINISIEKKGYVEIFYESNNFIFLPSNCYYKNGILHNKNLNIKIE